MKKLIIFISLFLMFACSPAHAGDYVATIKSVYDGDTIKVEVEIWPGLFQRTSVRIKGIDTPELRTRNTCEKALALKAKQALKMLVGDAIVISNIQTGKYAGRVLADVRTMQNVDVGAYMMGEGFAREYHGGKRQPWCVK